VTWLSRLDAYATDGDEFHKPRRGDCPLCQRPVINHPCMRHRHYAARELVVRRIDRALLILHWY
jgi:hypothetical protein